MIFVAAIFLGFALGSAALFGKNINSSAGFGIANRNMHSYFSFLGAASNLIIPTIMIIAGMVVVGLGIGVLIAISLILGALLAGCVTRSSHYLMLFSSLIGVPLAVVFYIVTLCL